MFDPRGEIYGDSRDVAILPEEQLTEAGELNGPSTNPENWLYWPAAMIPVALVGFLLATRVWNAKPKPKGAVVEEKKEGPKEF